MSRICASPVEQPVADDGQVLRDADRSLANWLGLLLPQGVGLRFETPHAQWVTDPPEPLFVDAFLHGIRQDGRGRQSGWSDVRDSDGHVVARQPAPQYYRLTYVLTAWAAGQEGRQDAGDLVMAEHELLGLLLDGCAQNAILPDDCLEGALAESGMKAVLECAPSESTAPASLWDGFGLAPRAHLELALLAPARPPAQKEIAPPARQIVVNATQKPRATSSAPPQPPFGTTRRWEKQSINEPPPASPAPVADHPAT